MRNSKWPIWEYWVLFDSTNLKRPVLPNHSEVISKKRHFSDFLTTVCAIRVCDSLPLCVSVAPCQWYTAAGVALDLFQPSSPLPVPVLVVWRPLSLSDVCAPLLEPQLLATHQKCVHITNIKVHAVIFCQFGQGMNRTWCSSCLSLRRSRSSIWAGSSKAVMVRRWLNKLQGHFDFHKTFEKARIFRICLVNPTKNKSFWSIIIIFTNQQAFGKASSDQWDSHTASHTVN